MANGTRFDPDAQWAKWVRLIAALAIIPLIAWGVSVEVRLSMIEGNRFTSTDALKLYDQLHSKADKADVPPPEVRESLQEIKTAIHELRDLITGHVQWHLESD